MVLCGRVALLPYLENLIRTLLLAKVTEVQTRYQTALDGFSLIVLLLRLHTTLLWCTRCTELG